MKSIKSILSVAFGAVIAMTSCNSVDDSPYVTRWPYADSACFLRITDNSTGETTSGTGVGYVLDFNYTDATADITINGLKLGGISYPSMILKGLTFSYDQSGWKHVSASHVRPEISGFADVPNFDRFTLSILERAVNEINPSTGMAENVYSPVIWISYEVDGKYSVDTYPRVMKYFGTTTTRTLEDMTGSAPSTTSSADTWYQIEIDPATLTAEVDIHKPAFAENMPSNLVLQFPGLPCSIQGNQIIMSKTELTPQVGGADFTRAEVTNVNGQLGITSNFNFVFNCNFGGTLYSVVANCAVVAATNN